MNKLLLFVGIVLFGISGMVFAVSQGAIHEILSAIIFVAGAIFFTGGAITGAINNLKFNSGSKPTGNEELTHAEEQELKVDEDEDVN